MSEPQALMIGKVLTILLVRADTKVLATATMGLELQIESLIIMVVNNLKKVAKTLIFMAIE